MLKFKKISRIFFCENSLQTENASQLTNTMLKKYVVVTNLMLASSIWCRSYYQPQRFWLLTIWEWTQSYFAIFFSKLNVTWIVGHLVQHVGTKILIHPPPISISRYPPPLPPPPPKWIKNQKSHFFILLLYKKIYQCKKT